MMKKRISIPSLFAGIMVWLSVSVFCGCGREAEMIPFSEESVFAQAQEEENRNMLQEAETSESGSEELREIVVYLCGAVKIPGVYTLPAGSRINDAVNVAGGFAEDAAVQTINLAARLQDEEMIYVLTQDEAEKKSSGELSGLGSYIAAEFQGVDTGNSGLIDINSADIDGLCKLPGIGESKARDIVMYREEHGSFRKKEDIMKVSGIKENLYKKICDLIFVGAP